MNSSVNLDAVNQIIDWLGSGSINIFGLPFAGKDTQAHALGEILNAPVVGGGAILRSSPDKEHVKQLMATGELFPTDYYLETVLPYLSQPAFLNKPLVLSSVGRWSGEELTIIDAAIKAGHPIKAAVWLRLTQAEVRRRWELAQDQQDRGMRHDDAEHLIDVRLQEFDKKTLPVIESYRKRGLLLEVDGTADTKTVTANIVDCLCGAAQRNS